MKKSKNIFVLVGEESGDIIAFDLIQEIKKQNKEKFNLNFFGITGPRMKSRGVSSIFDFTEINYLGVIKSFDAFIKKMLLSKSGTVLIMSSIAGWIGLPRASAYAPTKSALRLFAQSIRYDLAEYNIVVKLCSPGFVNTKAVKVNDFKMPGLIEPNVAAKIILKNVNSKKFESTLPWLFSALMKFLTYLPDILSYKLIKYVTLYDKEK